MVHAIQPKGLGAFALAPIRPPDLQAKDGGQEYTRGTFSFNPMPVSQEHRHRDLGDASRRLDHTDRRLHSSAAQQRRLNLFQPEQCGSACGQQLPSVYVVLLGDADIITTALEVMR